MVVPPPRPNENLSVREYARIQSLPHSFRFDLDSRHSLVTGVIKLMVNAVPDPLSISLGRQLRKVQFTKYLVEKDEEAPREAIETATKLGNSIDNAVDLGFDAEVEKPKEEFIWIEIE
ncbi:hypothetical protein B7494_g4691 [Chlorociboria aeruginascens]|nr:hypothetical protein B7494_g4691 [Chlorociboria aeruginascens]